MGQPPAPELVNAAWDAKRLVRERAPAYIGRAMTQRTAKPLRLLAEDADDLEIVSAAIQDGLMTMSTLQVDARGRRLTAPMTRFRWERARRSGARERVAAALQIGGVLGIRSTELARDDDTPRPILNISFMPDDAPPSGVLTMNFAGGGALEVRVECLDVMIADVSHPWPTRRKPNHNKVYDQ